MDSNTSRPSRAKRPLAAALLAAAAILVAVVAWLATRPGLSDQPAATAGPSVETPRPADSARPPAAESERGDASRAAFVAAAGSGLEIPVGVRLSGPGRLIGRVVDRTTGAGVGGARVDLHPLPPAAQEFFGRVLRLAKTGEEFSSRVEPIAVVATDADGSFAFEGVRAGTYFIEARGERHVPDSVARARVAASGDGGPLDVWVRPGGRIVGVVLAPGGGAAAGVQLSLTPGAGTIIESARRGDARYVEARADERGAFILAGVPPGDGYEIAAIGAGFAIARARDIAVRAGEDTFVEIATRTGATVEGRVLSQGEATFEGEPKGPTPLAGAHVGIVPRGLRDLAYAEEILRLTHGVTDADGRFRLQHVPAGELDLVGVASEHLASKGPRVIVGEAGTVVAADFELPRGPMASGRVVDSAGAPIAGVVVRWNAIDFRNFQFDFTFAALLAQAVEGFDFPKTDADGRFTAGALAGDPPHPIDFYRSGYEHVRHDWDPAKEPDGFEVVMRRGGAIEGIVMDGARHVPVPSFTIETDDRVEVQADAPGNMNPFSGGILVEDPMGRFRVDPVRKGKVELTFRAPGYLEETVSVENVSEGETTRGVIVELSPGGRIAGRVVDADGVAVAGAQVFALPEKGASRNAFGGRRRRGPPQLEDLPPGLRDFAAALGLLADRAVISKPDGTFELAGLDPGSTIAFAAHRDYVVGRSEPVVVALEGEPPQVEIALSKGGALFGRATDRFDRPVPGAIVLALSPANLAGEGSSSGGGLYQGATDAEGEYRIERMVGGSYFVVLTRGDEALNPMSFLGTLNFDLVTVPGDDAVEYDIVDTSSGATRVFGQVLDGAVPVASGNVSAISFEASNQLGVDFKLAQIQDGWYEFAGLAAGEYQFHVDAAGRGRGQVRIMADVPDAPELRLDLRFPGGAIEGRVVDARDGAPIERADVTLRHSDPFESSGWLGQMLAQEAGVERERTDERGEFRFEGLEQGSYQLTARARGDDEHGRYAPSEPQTVEVGDDTATRGVEFRLAPAVELAGRVLDDTGAPIDDVTLIAVRVEPAGGAQDRARSDEDGEFRFAALSPGKYDVSASRDGYATATAKAVEVGAAAAKPLDLTLARGVEVKVVVLGEGNRPLAGATGRLVAAGESTQVTGADVGRAFENLFSGKGVSGADGVLDLGRFGPGEYRLTVQRGSSKHEEALKIEAGGPVELRVRLR
jgi:protocatechuate 3,4-dioxygenase beta subunit